eukprot:TRINITY_DN2366_c0_g1_i3.p1 TRINITY_DN2366_c0_g1~~TRINITY_DN2366_c0_g1_i3.p1  ORF type:complete len:194 (-),score=35.99 TRINITY_DN2366_c0_g1_i3:541-1122(-)
MLRSRLEDYYDRPPGPSPARMRTGSAGRYDDGDRAVRVVRRRVPRFDRYDEEEQLEERERLIDYYEDELARLRALVEAEMARPRYRPRRRTPVRDYYEYYEEEPVERSRYLDEIDYISRDLDRLRGSRLPRESPIGEAIRSARRTEDVRYETPIRAPVESRIPIDYSRPTYEERSVSTSRRYETTSRPVYSYR